MDWRCVLTRGLHKNGFKNTITTDELLNYRTELEKKVEKK
jgi:hypothetical protein